MTPATTRRRTANDSARDELLRLLDEAYAGPAWHGMSVRAALRGVGPEEAVWSPGEGRHSILDLVLHLAYARHQVRGRLTPDERLDFPRRMARSWWPLPIEDASLSPARRWRRELALLEEQHRLLVDAVRRATPQRLSRRFGSAGMPLRQHVSGTALHDAYHTGQLRLLRRLYASTHAAR